MTLAREVLDRQLLDLASRGERPRCGEYQDRDMWTSDDRDERARAARLCAACPLLRPCAEAAEESAETFGTWAGRDLTRTPRRKRVR